MFLCGVGWKLFVDASQPLNIHWRRWQVIDASSRIFPDLCLCSTDVVEEEDGEEESLRTGSSELWQCVHVWSCLIIFDHGHVHFWGSKVLYCWTWPGAFLVWQVPLQQRPLAWKKLCTSSGISRKQKVKARWLSFVVFRSAFADLWRPKTATSQGSADHNAHISESQRSYSFYSGTWLLWLARTLLQRLPSKLLAVG